MAPKKEVKKRAPQLLRWTDAERRLVAERVYDLLLLGEVRSEAFDKAQRELLSPERWWPPNKVSSRSFNLRPYIEEVRVARQKQAIKLAPAPASEEAAPAPQPTQEDSERREDIQPRPVRPGWRDIVIDMAREVLVNAINDPRTRSAVTGFLSEIIPDVVREVGMTFGMAVKQSNHEPHIVPPKPNMETVAILGGLSRQWEGIRNTYGEHFDLRFIDTNKPAAYIKGMARGASICYLMTGFISHAAQDAVLSTGVPKAFINGSMTALADALEARLDMHKRRGISPN